MPIPEDVFDAVDAALARGEITGEEAVRLVGYWASVDLFGRQRRRDYHERMEARLALLGIAPTRQSERFPGGPHASAEEA